VEAAKASETAEAAVDACMRRSGVEVSRAIEAMRTAEAAVDRQLRHSQGDTTEIIARVHQDMADRTRLLEERFACEVVACGEEIRVATARQDVVAARVGEVHGTAVGAKDSMERLSALVDSATGDLRGDVRKLRREVSHLNESQQERGPEHVSALVSSAAGTLREDVRRLHREVSWLGEAQ